MANPLFRRGFHRGTGDPTHSQTGDVLEIVLPGESTNTHARQLHVCQSGDVNSDWDIAAQSHPTLYLHSVTTPITDYLRLGGHDGTTAYADVVGGTTLALQIAGTSHFTVAASAIAHSAANSGAVTSLDVTNTSDDSGAGARIRVAAGGSSATLDALFSALETSGHEITIGIDTSANTGVIAMDATLGSADGDAVRITDATPPVITYNATHPTGTFDYVCGTCGQHGGEMFACCGLVEWHDDVAALAPVLAGLVGERLTGNEPAVRHLAKLGVMEVTPGDLPGEEDKNWVGIRLDAAQWFTWSAMHQLYNRITALEAKLVTA